MFGELGRTMEFLNYVHLPFGYLLPFIAALTIIVFIHELGHFMVARWCGVAVEIFSIGFGREIFGWNDKHGTRWKVCWLPLGGYVKFEGDANPTSFPQEADIRDTRRVLGTGEGGRAPADVTQCVARALPGPRMEPVPGARRSYWGQVPMRSVPPDPAAVAAVEALNRDPSQPGGGIPGVDLLVLALPEGEVRWRLEGGRLVRSLQPEGMGEGSPLPGRSAPGRTPTPYARNIARAAATRAGPLVRVEIELGKRSGEAARRPIAVTEVRLRTEDAAR